MKSVLFAFFTLLLNTTFAQNDKWVVAADGTGKYTTVQAAFDAVPEGNKKAVTIFVKSGTYKEKLRLAKGKSHVTLEGENKFTTILTYDDHTGKIGADGKVINTSTSASFFVLADNFIARNITFQNDAGFTAGQAVALEADGDHAAFYNCRIVGNQDILFHNNDAAHQYYEHCYLEGTTDFIFGSSTVWFEQCHIHSKKNSHVTAASTPQNHDFGYVFNDCILTGDTSLHSVSLGRPWRPYASVIYMRTYIGPHIMPTGWATWNNSDSYKNSRYSEYKNYGPGAATATRVDWSRQLNDDDYKNITVKKVLGWQPG